MCGGDGCRACDGGQFEIAVCPRRYVGADVWALLEAAELYEKGLPPVMGGTLDQSAWFVAAARTAWCERDRWLSEKPVE